MRVCLPVIAVAICLGVSLPLTSCSSIAVNESRNAEEWESERAEIFRVLDEQATAWNRGDLDAFMEGYWRSPELVFTSGGVVRRGWQTTLDRYRETYGDERSTMGTLSFTDLEVHRLGHDSAWALGRWRLDLEEGERLGGVFTLVFRQVDGEWKVVHDHTSTAPPR